MSTTHTSEVIESFRASMPKPVKTDDRVPRYVFSAIAGNLPCPFYRLLTIGSGKVYPIVTKKVFHSVQDAPPGALKHDEADGEDARGNPRLHDYLYPGNWVNNFSEAYRAKGAGAINAFDNFDPVIFETEYASDFTFDRDKHDEITRASYILQVTALKHKYAQIKDKELKACLIEACDEILKMVDAAATFATRALDKHRSLFAQGYPYGDIHYTYMRYLGITKALLDKADSTESPTGVAVDLANRASATV